MLWTLLFLGLFAGAAAGILYLAGRVRKFQFIEKLSKGSKKEGIFSGVTADRCSDCCIMEAVGIHECNHLCAPFDGVLGMQ